MTQGCNYDSGLSFPHFKLNFSSLERILFWDKLYFSIFGAMLHLDAVKRFAKIHLNHMTNHPDGKTLNVIGSQWLHVMY